MQLANLQNMTEQVDLPYKWDQTLQDVTMTIPVPANTRGKDLHVDIDAKTLRVKLVRDNESIVDGELFKSVATDDCTWTIVDQKEVVITLEKSNKSEWWPHILTKDPKIDVTKIQPENSKLEDLDGETRAMVEKMMFDQRQKQQGLPSSDELKKHEALDRFKKQHPEMDFSQIKDLQ